MLIKFAKLDERAKIPKLHYRGDAGLDIHTLDGERIAPGEQVIIRTGVFLKYMPRGYVIQVWPKSGLDARLGAHTGAGIIDPNYRGEILILVKNTNSKHWIEFEAGDAVAQLIIVLCAYPVAIEEVPMSTPAMTDRGADGGIARI